MAAKAFTVKLAEQIGNELAAHVQYLAIASWYEGETLPTLAGIFYEQAREEHDHALMMVQYLLDVDAPVAVPAIPAPQWAFADIVLPVALALDQERSVTQQISELTRIGQVEGDFQSERFMDWFLKEQTEEVSKMRDLLATVERGRDAPLQVEQFLASASFLASTPDPTAPSLAGVVAGA